MCQIPTIAHKSQGEVVRKGATNCKVNFLTVLLKSNVALTRTCSLQVIKKQGAMHGSCLICKCSFWEGWNEHLQARQLPYPFG